MTFQDNWNGGITWSTNSHTCIVKIFGTIIHQSNTVPEWGEVVGYFPNYTDDRSYPLMSYSTRGKVYNSFVMCNDGYIRVYGSDRTQMNVLDEVMYFVFIK